MSRKPKTKPKPVRRIVIREGSPNRTPIKKRPAISRCGMRICGWYNGIVDIEQAMSANIKPPRTLSVYRSMGQWRCNTNYGGRQVICMSKDKKKVERKCNELNESNRAFFDSCVSRLLNICDQYELRVCHYLRNDYSGYYVHPLWKQ